MRGRRKNQGRGRPSSWTDDIWFDEELHHFTQELGRYARLAGGWKVAEGPTHDDDWDYHYLLAGPRGLHLLQVRWSYPKGFGVELWDATQGPPDALSPSLWNEAYLPEQYDEILQRISADVLGYGRPAAVTKTAPASSDLDVINRHRTSIGMGPIDPSAGWTAQELADMAESIRTTGRMTNPSTLRAVYDGSRRGKAMFMVLPMSDWGGRAYGLGKEDAFRTDPPGPRQGQEVGLTLSDAAYGRLSRQRELRRARRRSRNPDGNRLKRKLMR